MAIPLAATTTPITATSITGVPTNPITTPTILQAVTTTPLTLATSDYTPDDPLTTTHTPTVHTTGNVDSTLVCPQCAHTLISRIGLGGLMRIRCTKTGE
nr:unnamed protein product [Spirometra erinaceieuropaei]